MPVKIPNRAVSIKGVSKSFGGVQAVRDVSLDVANGERRVVIGTNGAGKTTLFNLIAGDLRATAGEIYVFETSVTRLPVYKRARLGMKRTYQTSALFDGLSVRENLYLALLGEQTFWNHLNFFQKNTASTSMAGRIEGLVEQVGLSQRVEDEAGGLSHGERRQLEIALALATSPRVLLLDEPAAGLSVHERGTMMDILRSLRREMTLILIEHDMSIALGVADIVTVMHEGAVIAEGKPDEIQRNKRVQEIYLGEDAGA